MEYLSDPWESLLTNYGNKEAFNERAKILDALEQVKVIYSREPEKLEVLEEVISIVRNL